MRSKDVPDEDGYVGSEAVSKTGITSPVSPKVLYHVTSTLLLIRKTHELGCDDTEAREVRVRLGVEHEPDPELERTLERISEACFAILEQPELREWLRESSEWQPLRARAQALSSPRRELGKILPNLWRSIYGVYVFIGGKPSEGEERRRLAA